jgi:cystathionine beta-lyase family protein involved in aluminum resistance
LAGFDGVLAFDLEQEQWREMKGPSMQDAQLMLPQICECNGCLLMVEVVSKHFMMTHVSIGALRQLDNKWFKLASMPQKVLEEVIGISGDSSSSLVLENTNF